MSLKGKTAIITGSTSGIGLGIAHSLAAQGANIVLNGMGEQAAIDAIQAEIKATHAVGVMYHPADMTKSVALEVAQQNITVNAICPGYVQTPLVQKQIADQAKTRGISEEDVIKNVILGAQPTKKFTTVEQIGALTVFLCSDAAQNITGSMQSIDGGWVAA